MTVHNGRATFDDLVFSAIPGAKNMHFRVISSNIDTDYIAGITSLPIE